jgi:hypothetical protein
MVFGNCGQAEENQLTQANLHLRTISMVAVLVVIQPVVWGQLPTVAQWREDLAYLAERIEMQHPNAFATMERSEFEAAVAKLNADIPDLPPHEIAVAMIRLAAMVGDGHTQMNLPVAGKGDEGPAEELGFHRLPISFYQFSDGLFIRHADEAHNSGGNNNLNRPIIHGIIVHDEKIDRKGKLFCIIGRQTFSAAMNCVSNLEQRTKVIFVGEPTAGAPNHFGDAKRIQLPNSKLIGGVSTRFWQDSRPREIRPWVPPDVPVQISSKDYLSNHDPVLQAVLDWER